MSEKGRKTRTNTFLNKEYFKIITVAYTKEKTEKFAQFLTGSEVSQRGVYNCPYLKTQIIVFPRFVSKLDHQATTVAVEALLIYIDNEEEFFEIKEILHRYGQVPVRVLISDFEAHHLASQIGAVWYKRTDDNQALKDYLHKCDQNELKKIKDAFEMYDKDGSGAIDNEEMTKIAISLGEDTNDENFKKSMFALDLNQDGEISLSEFISWWKIGRQNTIALPKVYDLFISARDYIDKYFKLQPYSQNIYHIEEENINKTSSQKLLFRSPGVFRLKTFVEFALAIGGAKRLEMACDFLSQFTKNVSSAKTNWVSILIPLNQRQKDIDHFQAKVLIDEFKDNCLKWGEENTSLAFISFVKNLLVFESNSNETSVILAIRLKIDIEDLIKSALQHFLYIFENLQPKKESSWVNFKAHSNCDLYDSVNRDLTLGEFFEVSELVLEGNTFRDRMKAFFECLNEDIQKVSGLLQFFFQPYTIDMEIDCNLNELTDTTSKGLMNIKLNKFGFVLDFLRKNLSSKLLEASNNIEIGFNCFDIFARFKLFTQSTFCGKTSIREQEH